MHGPRHRRQLLQSEQLRCHDAGDVQIARQLRGLRVHSFRPQAKSQMMSKLFAAHGDNRSDDQHGGGAGRLRGAHNRRWPE